MTDWLSDNRRFLLRFAGTLLAIGLIVLLLRRSGLGRGSQGFQTAFLFPNPACLHSDFAFTRLRCNALVYFAPLRKC